MFSSAQINEKAYHRAAEELAAVKKESVELKVNRFCFNSEIAKGRHLAMPLYC